MNITNEQKQLFRMYLITIPKNCTHEEAKVILDRHIKKLEKDKDTFLKNNDLSSMNWFSRWLEDDEC